MELSVEVRYVVPPLINFVLFLILTSDGHQGFGGGGKLWELIVAADGHPIAKLAFYLASIYLLALFLFVAIRLSLTVNRLQVSRGEFSIYLMICFIVSIILPPPLFWLVFLIVLTLASTRSLLIFCTPQPQPQQVGATTEVDVQVV